MTSFFPSHLLLLSVCINIIAARVPAAELSPTYTNGFELSVAASSFTATGNTLVAVTLGFSPIPGQVLMVVNNTGDSQVNGTFTGLPEGGTLSAVYGGNTFTFQISYKGGDGNDITLTRVGANGQLANGSTFEWSNLVGVQEWGGKGSADGVGPLASFDLPQSPAVDNAGNVYVADQNNHTIRKVSAAGVVSTLAGSAGKDGSADGTGSAARFNRPRGVGVDNMGNVYVADSSNHTIRKITPAGVVTTMAGSAGLRGSRNGTGSTAKFYHPEGVAVDSAGNVYVADSSNHTIRKVTPAGAVSTLAGSAGLSGTTNGTGSAASFYYPGGVAVDSAGNVYVADSSNHTIRKVTPAGAVSTLAGSAGLSGTPNGTGSAARFDYPRGVAVDSAGNVYVAESSNHTIRKVTPAGAVSTLAGSAGQRGSSNGTGDTARFISPAGLAADSAGNVYVADTFNHTIRKVTPAGLVSTLAGRAPSGGVAIGTSNDERNYPTGVAVDSSGNVYVVDRDNHTIRKVTPAGEFSTLAGSVGQSGSADGIGAAARFNSPSGLAVDSAGNLYVADYRNHTIRKVTPAGEVSTLAGSAGIVGSTDGTTGAARFYAPLAVSVDSAGNVYKADSFNHTIRKVTPDGVVTTLAGSARLSGSDDGTGSTAKFYYPQGVSVDSAGNVYVADRGNHTIRKLTPAGVVSTLAGSAGINGSTNGSATAARFDSPYGVSVDSAGNVYVADSSNHTIRKVTPTGVVSTLAGSAGIAGSTDGTAGAARFFSPESLSVDSTGNVFVADSGNNMIRKVSAEGVVSTVAGSAGFEDNRDGSLSVAKFGATSGVAADRAGNLYVPDSFYHTIRKVTPAGMVTTLAGKAGAVGSADGAADAARFYSPSKLAVDDAGNVYVTEPRHKTIRKVTPEGVVSTLAGSAGQSGSADGRGSAARFHYTRGIAVDGAGNVYVADNHTIRKVTPAGVVSTLAGQAGQEGNEDGKGSAARFYEPAGIAVDRAGNAYVTDSEMCIIRKVTPTGVVSTLAGRAGEVGGADGIGSVARFAFPEGITVDTEGNLYVTDWYTIRKVTPAGVVSTLGGQTGSTGKSGGRGSSARFNFPSGICVSPSGVVYVTEYGGRIVQGQMIGFKPLLELSSVSDLGGSGATLNGIVSPNGFATQAQFEYGLNNLYDRTAVVTLSPPQGTATQNVSVQLTGLTPGSVYCYRLSASNVDGAQTRSGGTFTIANLKALALSSGTLTPAFAIGTKSYTASVAHAVSAVAIRPTAAQPNATLLARVNGGDYVSVVSGRTSTPLPLNVGSNTVEARITAQDGTSTQTYTITVLRAPAISVQQPAGVALTNDRSVVNFDGVMAPASTSRVFVVRNMGLSSLTAMSVSIAGADAADFSLSEMPAPSLAGGKSTSFTVVFRPASIGIRNAVLRVTSSDTLIPTFEVALTGTGTEMPAFIEPLASQLVVAGAVVTLTGSASGGALSFQWLKNGINIKGATAGVYSFPSITLANAGGYSVKALNASGSVTSSAVQLGVVDATAKQYKLGTGATASFSIMTAGSGLSYIWKKGGFELPVDERITGRDARVLTIKNLTVEDAGVYTCEVTGPGGTLNGGANTLLVLDRKPEILLPVFMPDAIVSGNYSFQIPVNGSADLTPASYTATGLPSGLSCDKTTGVVSGKPVVSRATPYVVTFVVTNVKGSATASSTLQVYSLPSNLPGTFNGLVDRSTELSGPSEGIMLQGHGGRLSNLVITNTGSFTGTLLLEEKNYRMPKGSRLDTAIGADATATVKLVRGTVTDNIPDLNLQFTIDMSTGELSGTLTEEEGVAALGVKAWRKNAPKAGQAGHYTAVFEFEDTTIAGDISYPQGNGYLLMKVSATGAVTWGGKLADGMAITGSSTVAAGGDIPFHQMLYSGTSAVTAGSAHGWLKISDDDPTGLSNDGYALLEGVINWGKKKQATESSTRSYKQGFPVHNHRVLGGRYVAPEKGDLLLDLEYFYEEYGDYNATLAFLEGGLTGPDPIVAAVFAEDLESVPVAVKSNNRVIVWSYSYEPDELWAVSVNRNVTLGFNLNSGLMSGSLTLRNDPDPTDSTEPIAELTRRVGFTGVLVPRLDRGVGQFQLPELPSWLGELKTSLKTSPIWSGQVIFEPQR